jgi:hypothetical protein
MRACKKGEPKQSTVRAGPNNHAVLGCHGYFIVWIREHKNTRFISRSSSTHIVKHFRLPAPV